MQITRISQTFNNSSGQTNVGPKAYSAGNMTFTGAQMPVKSKFFAPLKRFFHPVEVQYEKVTMAIAKGLAKVLETKAMEKLIQKTKTANLVPHLQVLGSVILSGFYIKKTLQNDKLEEKRRNTLAVNQGIVWGLSTILGYSIDSKINNGVNKFISKYKEINHGNPTLGKYVNGIKIAKSVMIFDVVYRFIAPVVVTPIANAIGNAIQDKKEAKLATAKAHSAKA